MIPPSPTIPGFTGTLFVPGTREYEEARTVTNASVDRKPVVIARPTSSEDVAALILWGRQAGLDISIRTGGHAAAGFAIADGGLVIDLRSMKDIDIAPDALRARIGGGLLWREFDARTQQYALGVPGPRVSTVGVAGFALASGSGWLERAFGLATDHVIGASLVTAEGRLVRASDDENEELFWALRGGGGNFGVVVELDFRIRPLGPDVLAGTVVHRWDDVLDVAVAYRDAMDGAPDSVGGGLLLAVPRDMGDRPRSSERCANLVLIDAGKASEAERTLKPLRQIGAPIVDLVARVPYVRFQSAFDAPEHLHLRQHFECGFLHDVPDEALVALAAHCDQAPSQRCSFLLTRFGGVAGSQHGTALERTNRRWAWQAMAAWETPDLDDTHRAWIAGARRILAPSSAGEAYPNLIADQSIERIRNSYGRQYERLSAIKHAWDPDNVFRGNHNIQPAERSNT